MCVYKISPTLIREKCLPHQVVMRFKWVMYGQQLVRCLIHSEHSVLVMKLPL